MEILKFGWTYVEKYLLLIIFENLETNVQRKGIGLMNYYHK